jgi:L-lactate dehydrogenase complex protein LldG
LDEASPGPGDSAGQRRTDQTRFVMNDREQVLSRVRDALAPLPKRASRPAWQGELLRLPTAPPATDRWDQFAQRFAAVNGIPFTAIADIVLYLEKNSWYRGYCDPALWPALRDAFPAEFRIATTFDRTRVDDYDFGITRASGAIAESGTIILTDRDTPTRLAALAPWVHIALVSPDTILPDIPAAVAGLGTDPNVIWVTGPSKTADVEGILIEGVHGPGAQLALRWCGYGRHS